VPPSEISRGIRFRESRGRPAKGEVSRGSRLPQRLNLLRQTLRDRMDRIEFILLNLELFIEPDTNYLNERRSEYARSINDIVDIAQECIRSSKSCQEFEGALTEITYPKRKLEQCELRRAPACGVEEFKLAVSSDCEPLTFRIMRHEVCGIEDYVLGRNPACGVELYSVAENPECGFRDPRGAGNTVTIPSDVVKSGRSMAYLAITVGKET